MFFVELDVKLSSILSDEVLYSWGGKDIMRKVIVLSSCVPDNIDTELKLTLMVSQQIMLQNIFL